MRVLILSQYYTPEPVPKPGELARALAERGHSVAVVTGFPNYPSGKLYQGFRLGLLKREKIDGIPVTRTYEFPYHGKSVVGRVFNYLTFMLSAPLGSFFAPKCDAIYVWHPPLTIGLSAWLIARMRGVPFVYDVQDIWPEAAVVSGLLKRGWLIDFMDKLEKFVYRRADYLLVVTDGARNNLISKGVAAAKISVMPHWVEESIFQQNAENTGLRLREEYGWKDRFVVLFAGNIGIVQGLEVVVRAAMELQSNGDVLFALVGDGTDKARLQQLADQIGLDNIHFIERQPMERMPEFMTGADALLVHLKKSEFSRHAIPGKTLAYLAAGKPILMAVEGAAAQLVTEAGAGIVVSPEDPKALADAIRSVIAMPEAERAAMGERGRQYLLENLSKQKVISQYEEILQRVASRNGR
jgi:colanic acid biosynthesis glycosyl transferase WcaI